MRTATAAVTTTTALIALALCPGWIEAQYPFCYLPLPTRAFVVEGGAIALQAFVTPNREARPGTSGDARYPTGYVLIVRNETGRTLWATVDWRFPGEEWKSRDANKMNAGDCTVSLHNRLGVVADTPIQVRIAVYGDKKRGRTLGVEEASLLFTAAEREQFLEAYAAGGNTLMTGWPEMGHPATDVPGTIADADLQADIQLLIWKEESKAHRDCTHEALRAEAAPLDTSAVVRAMLAEAQTARARRAERAARQNQRRDTAQAVVRLERWFMRSCDALTTYLALLVPTPDIGGTDVVVRRQEAPAGGP